MVATAVAQEFIRRSSEVDGAGLDKFLYNFSGYGYVLAWGISFYPQLLLNWRRKSTTGMSIGFLWYNLLGFGLYLVYTTYSPDCNFQDQLFAGHALLITALTLVQVPAYNVSKRPLWQVLGDFPQGYARLLGALLIALDVCIMLHTAHIMSFISLVYACGYLKTAISLIKYTPQLYLNWQRKSTNGFAIGMVFCDLCGGLLSIFQTIVSCAYDDSTGLLRDHWTWEPFTGNKPKVMLGFIAIFYDLSFFYQHFILYPIPIEDIPEIPSRVAKNAKAAAPTETCSTTATSSSSPGEGGVDESRLILS